MTKQRFFSNCRSFLPYKLLAFSLVLLVPALVSAEDPAIVRLSFVQGTVQLLQAGQSEPGQAVANMPLFEGASITTAMDGQAEVEFADGSVARLTPNSSLQLTRLQRPGPTGHTAMTLLSGVGYFELNVGQGQQFAVKFATSTLRPLENSIFRAGLDAAPEAAVMQGTIHVDGGGFTTDVSTNQELHLDVADSSQYSIADGMTMDSWDQWNADRDAAIAEMSANQTAVRDDSQAPGDPAWNDLDYYGNWYPVEGYGDVWTPNDAGAGWDPFGYGYWGSYSGYGTTWISGYPWGWLPYHCGAWNYFPFGWGWVPGGCGLGWSPIVTVWNTPSGYRLPGWPRGPAIVPSQGRHPLGSRLVPVDRGSAARGPWGEGGATILHNRGVQGVAAHTQPLQLDGNTIQPLPVVHVATPVALPGERVVVNSGPHVGVPVGTSALRSGNPAIEGGASRLGYNGSPRSTVERMPGNGESHPIGRSTYTPAPHASPPPAAAPHASAPTPAPAPAAHH